jgi:hypothetical protein
VQRGCQEPSQEEGGFVVILTDVDINKVFRI